MLNKQVSAVLQLCQMHRAFETLNMRKDYSDAFYNALVEKIDNLILTADADTVEQLEFALYPFPKFYNKFKKVFDTSRFFE